MGESPYRFMDGKRIAIIGAGNVASHLAQVLSKKHSVKQIASRNLARAQQLAEKIPGCEALQNLSDLHSDLDFYILAVSDSAISETAENLPCVAGIVAHTSGSTPIEALKSSGHAQGVFYPLQTFSKEARVDFSSIPFFIEGSSVEAANALSELASSISRTVHLANSELRAKLHLAAVFGCNFANHLWSIANDILAEAGLDFSIMGPLLQTTLDKALNMPPAKAQTGPAARCDMATIERQEAALEGIPKDIYTLITKSIILQHKNEPN